jgi:hypothetical protein
MSRIQGENMKKPKKNLEHQFVLDFAKRRCEWVAPMFNPCGAVRALSNGRMGGAVGCWSCRARWILKQKEKP